MVNNTITAAEGFAASGAACGIKKSGKNDLGLIVCPAGCKAAAVFTTNKIVGAAVRVCREHVKSAGVRAVVVNSGNANACTGKKGLSNAIAMCREVGKLAGCDAHKVLVASTGIIGEQLPMNKVKMGIKEAVQKLSNSQSGGLSFARAIMTTDTVVKQAICKIKIVGKNVTIAGCVKGAGMIGPNMATTLCFLTTDVAITKGLLARALKDAIGMSLNKLTVDGHQSTNDTAIILASGAAGNGMINKQGTGYKKFAGGVAEVCSGLAKQMALDAEGATRMFTVVVDGAASREEAGIAVRAVANYDLVKCAIHGGDPNWGRIICAVGSCGVRLNEKKLSCKIGDVTVFRNGVPTRFDRKKASKIISGREHTITVDLGVGRCSDFFYGCDLSSEYVKINAEYHT